MTHTFTVNSKTYKTDAETANVLRDAAKEKKEEVFAAIMFLGLHVGCIVEA